MKIKQSYIAVGTICGLILLAHLYEYLSKAELPSLEYTYYFKSCPVSVKLPAPPDTEDLYGNEKVLTSAGGYLYRVSCIAVNPAHPGNISLLPADLLDMFNADEVSEIVDTNFEISGLASGPLFYYEFLGEREKKPMKSLGAFYFKNAYLLNVEIITYDPKQNNIDATIYFNSVQFDNEALKSPAGKPFVTGPVI